MNPRTDRRPRWLARCLSALAAMRRRARARRDLSSLDAYMLRDIGLSHPAAAHSLRTRRR
jgi:uncharacterized protein YjiS (DUF1127 family)